MAETELPYFKTKSLTTTYRRVVPNDTTTNGVKYGNINYATYEDTAS